MHGSELGYMIGVQRPRPGVTTDDALDSWRAAPSGKPGGQRTYADIAIEAALTIRMVFHLPLRQTEGFLRCLADLLAVDLPIPDHTTLSRRLQKLSEIRFRKLTSARPENGVSSARGTGDLSSVRSHAPTPR